MLKFELMTLSPFSLTKKFSDHILIPEGGYGKQGVKGAALISRFYKTKKFTHICCAAGTATTLAGLINSLSNNQQVVGFSAIKNINELKNRIDSLTGSHKNYTLLNDYCFGGYAKKNAPMRSACK